MAKKAAPKGAGTKAATASSGKDAGAEKGGRGRGLTKSDVYGQLAEKTGLSKKEVSVIFEAMSEMIARELGKKGPGQFTIPGLLKLQRISKPATKAKQGINPFTKEPMTIKAKPARNVIKAKPLKSLKELV